MNEKTIMTSLKEKYNNEEGQVEYLPYQHKRVCLALDLKNDPELIALYKHYHNPEHYWKEIGEGIKKGGIPVMEIYLVDSRMFMICELPMETDFDEAWKAIGQHERQDEWAALMATFQQALPGRKLEWVKLEKVYELPN
jgi:L-rhamnose mutarotase